MAINFHIDSGSSTKSAKKVNSAAASTRAQQTKSALVGQSQASDSGNVAVKSSGILGKIGKFLGPAAEIASQFVPGAAGTLIKGVANAFNDPEWWQTVPGDSCTLNQPLRLLPSSVGDEFTSEAPLGTAGVAKHTRFRPAIAEFTSCPHNSFSISISPVINPSDTAITQYLMPEIRKVVNAVPLQTASDYKQVLQANVAAYAMWRTLKKYDYMLKHGQTYLPSMNESTFPMFQVENSAKLTALINRLEEFLRSSVRLPHTLCEYLAWRYGRVYKSCNTAKAGLILYNVLPISDSVETYEQAVTYFMSVATSSKELQAANADMYNAYFDHDLMVEIRDDTQFQYDAKEFALRTNCDIKMDIPNYGTHNWYKPEFNDNPNPVFIDSGLDNPTVFMASVVSTLASRRTLDNQQETDVLFPIEELNAYIAHDIRTNASMAITASYMNADGSSATTGYIVAPSKASNLAWNKMQYQSLQMELTSNEVEVYCGLLQPNTGRLFANLLICKPLDIYNKDCYLPVLWQGSGSNVNQVYQGIDYQASMLNGKVDAMLVDLTSLDHDMANVTDDTIAVEHIYAFANLVNISRKVSESYATAEKRVARDTANLIDHMDVAALPTK